MQAGATIAGVVRGVMCAALLLVSGGSPGGVSAQASRDPYAAPRQELVEELRAMADNRGPRARIDDEVLDVLARVPRHRFVPAALRDDAYENRPLAIGHGQTISQPYIVALMTSLAQPETGDRILEIGTGSGYQAAVLAAFDVEVYTVEIIEPLAEQAARRLRGHDNVHTRIADGYHGWKAHAPFDSIVVTAAAASVPPPLIAQLKPGGRMVIPVGSSFFTQTLMLVEKDDDGRVRTRQILPVRFVPLTGGH